MAHKEHSNLTGKAMGAAKKAASYLVGETGILATLKKEHGEVSAMMKKILATEGNEDMREERRSLFEQMRRDLLAHAHGEEKQVYPKFLRHKETEALAKEGFAEHKDLEDTLTQLQTLDVSDPAWMSAFRTLHDDVTHHVAEEENEFFPKVADLMDREQLRELEAAYLQQKKAELQSIS